MENIPTQSLSRVMLFGALSRIPHVILELAGPALAALLWLGAIPSLDLILLGLVTAFAGYTSVYALNDLVDFRVDKERIEAGGFQDTEISVELGMVRHPMAQGLLGYGSGLVWAGAWAAVALVGAWILNPVCALIFIIGAGLEVVYCLLLKVTHLRAFVSGLVKTSGVMAAVFAVDHNPDPVFLALLFFWVYFWEIGGQNIPNDWHDLDEDLALKAKTIPLTYTQRQTGFLVMGCLGASVLLSLILFNTAPKRPPLPYSIFVIVAGIYLLILPALKLFSRLGRTQAGLLFSRATLYPPVVFAIVLVSILIG